MLGLLMGATGLGAFAASVYLASRRSVRGLIGQIARASALLSLGLITLSLARSTSVAAVALFVTGFGMIVQLAAGNTVLQTLVEEDKRGRVMSLYLMAFMGMTPWGSLLAGALANHVGVSRTLMAQGILGLAGALVFARQLPRIRAVVRPIYVKMGIIDELSGLMLKSPVRNG